MACNKCKTKEECGCKQEALHISQICNPVECAVEECSETFNAGCILYADADIICNEVVLVTAGNTMAQALANVTAYFCATETVEAEILCGVDVVVPADTNLEDAIPLVVAYFCSNLITDIQVSQASVVDINGCVTTQYTIENNNGTGLGATTLSSFEFTVGPICPPEAIQVLIDNSISNIPSPSGLYTGLLTQSGASDPTVSIPSGGNTIGAIVWTRFSTGIYRGTLAGAFTNTTICSIIQAPLILSSKVPCFLQMGKQTNDYVEIRVYDYDGVTLSDTRLTEASFRIETW